MVMTEADIESKPMEAEELAMAVVGVVESVLTAGCCLLLSNADFAYCAVHPEPKCRQSHSE